MNSIQIRLNGGVADSRSINIARSRRFQTKTFIYTFQKRITYRIKGIIINLHPYFERNAVNMQGIYGLILTLRRIMSYIYGAPILDVSRSHTTTQHSR